MRSFLKSAVCRNSELRLIAGQTPLLTSYILRSNCAARYPRLTCQSHDESQGNESTVGRRMGVHFRTREVAITGSLRSAFEFCHSGPRPTRLQFWAFSTRQLFPAP